MSTKAVSVMMTIKEREDLDNGNRCESWVWMLGSNKGAEFNKKSCVCDDDHGGDGGS